MLRCDGIRVQVCPPSTEEEWWDRLADLTALHQRGQTVGCFAQIYWTLASGLGLRDMELNYIFNDCLDEPLPRWKMAGLEEMEFFEFARYVDKLGERYARFTPESLECMSAAPVHKTVTSVPVNAIPSRCSRHRWRRKKLMPERPAVSADVYSPSPVSPCSRWPPRHSMPQFAAVNPAPVFEFATTIPAPIFHKATIITVPAVKGAVVTPTPIVRMAPIPEQTHKMTATPIPLHQLALMNSPALPKIRHLITSLMDVPLVAVRVAGVPRPVVSSSVVHT